MERKEIRSIYLYEFNKLGHNAAEATRNIKSCSTINRLSLSVVASLMSQHGHWSHQGYRTNKLTATSDLRQTTDCRTGLTILTNIVNRDCEKAIQFDDGDLLLGLAARNRG